jgi:cellulose synthase/poly-beta-1,6-N-acetylglucosamine synthase-like glycosyltransferase
MPQTQWHELIFGFLSVSAGILLLGYGGLLFRYHKAFSRALLQPPTAPLPLYPAVSVIVPARNEAPVIGYCLDSLLAQEYPGNWEIIVVDDHSTDETASIVRAKGVSLLSLADYPLPNQIAFKKHAIQTAIQQAKGEIILTTDADCQIPPYWIQLLTERLIQSNSVMCTGPVYMNPTQSLLSIFQTMDFAVLQGIGLASVFEGIHGLSSGASLAYRKDAFQAINGFEGINDIASGDDMLLMEKMQRQFPGRICCTIDNRCIVTTQTEKTWRNFFRQRIRWAGKAPRYESRLLKLILIWVYLFNLSLAALLLSAFHQPLYLALFAGFLLLKVIVEWPFVRNIFSFFSCKHLLPVYISAQPLHIFYTIISGTFGAWGKVTWKERRIP